MTDMGAVIVRSACREAAMALCSVPRMTVHSIHHSFHKHGKWQASVYPYLDYSWRFLLTMSQ